MKPNACCWTCDGSGEAFGRTCSCVTSQISNASEAGMRRALSAEIKVEQDEKMKAEYEAKLREQYDVVNELVRGQAELYLLVKGAYIFAQHNPDIPFEKTSHDNIRRKVFGKSKREQAERRKKI